MTEKKTHLKSNVLVNEKIVKFYLRLEIET